MLPVNFYLKDLLTYSIKKLFQVLSGNTAFWKSQGNIWYCSSLDNFFSNSNLNYTNAEITTVQVVREALQFLSHSLNLAEYFNSRKEP